MLLLCEFRNLSSSNDWTITKLNEFSNLTTFSTVCNHTHYVLKQNMTYQIVKIVLIQLKRFR